MQTNALAAVAFISGSLNLLTGIQVYRYNPIVSTKRFLYAMLGLTVYVWGYAAELTTITQQQAWFWLQVEYLGLNGALFFFAKFILKLRDVNTRTSCIWVILLWLLGVFYFLLLLSNPLHGWYYREIKMIPLWGAWLMQTTPGWAYWGYVIYLYTALLLMGVLSFWRIPHLTQAQIKQRMVLAFVIGAGLLERVMNLDKVVDSGHDQKSLPE